MTGPPTISVVLADDNVIVREGARALLARAPASAALAAAEAMHRAQGAVNAPWSAAGLPAFELGLSTGTVAAAYLGSEERAEYTVGGDAVNLCQRLQQLAAPGQIVLSEATWAALPDPPAAAERLPASAVKGRDGTVQPWRLTVVPTTPTSPGGPATAAAAGTGRKAAVGPGSALDGSVGR